MNIWFDQLTFASSASAPFPEDYRGNNCDNDGKGGDRPSFQRFRLLNTQISFIQEHYLQIPLMLYIQKLHSIYWIACDTGSEMPPVVLDAEAYALLEHFREPRRLSDLTDGQDLRLRGQAVALLLRLGLLRDLAQPLPEPMYESASTLAVRLHMTNACNLRCSYCYVRKNAEHMLDEVARRSVDAAVSTARAYNYRALHLTFAGGEPTLRLPEVLATCDYALERTRASDLSFSASLISNGTVLPLWALEQLRQRPVELVLSLDGVGEFQDSQRFFAHGHGSFAVVDRTIARLLEAQLVPFINVTVTARNLPGLPKLLEYLLQRDLPFGLSYYRENEEAASRTDLQFAEAEMIAGLQAAFLYLEEHLPRRTLLNALLDKTSIGDPHRYACGLGRHYMVIDQHGGVARCQMELRRPVATIHTADPLKRVREYRGSALALAVEEKEGCRSCQWRYWCRGGCPALTYRLTGRSDIRSPNCAIYQALFPRALRLEALRLLKYEQPVALSGD